MYIHPVQIIMLLLLALVLMAARMVYSSRRQRLAQKPDDREAGEIREVKGRVAVLERIVTDKEHSLSREIEQLRLEN